jgi:outer membrane protein assembly factor BamB
VEGIDERSASALWSNDALARRQLSAPEVFSSYVVFGDYEGYLHLVSQVDGRFVGRTRIDSDGLRARPLVVGDWLYAFGNGGNLVALTIK